MIQLKTFNKVLNHFDGNVDKAKLWFDTPNPLFEDIKPKEMAWLGRHKKLNALIEDALESNYY